MNAAGDQIIQLAECYTVQYFDEHGKRRKAPTGCQDKAEALRYANHLENEARKRRTGEIDPTAERFAKEARRPLAEHVADFRQFLPDKGNTPKHVRMTCRHVQVDTGHVNEAKTVSDLTGPAVMRAVGAVAKRAGQPADLQRLLDFGQGVSRGGCGNTSGPPDDALCGLESLQRGDRPAARPAGTDAGGVGLLLRFVESHTAPTTTCPARTGRWSTGWPSARDSGQANCEA